MLIDTSEVFCIFFPRLAKTLIFDLRPSEEGPLIALDDMAGGPRQRIEWLEAARPSLPLPDELRLVPWPSSTATLSEVGVEEALLRRCAVAGGDQGIAQCRKVLNELGAFERQLVRSIIRGEGTRTIWQRD